MSRNSWGKFGRMWRKCFRRGEFLLENSHEDVSEKEWGNGQTLRNVKRESRGSSLLRKRILIENDADQPAPECFTPKDPETCATSHGENERVRERSMTSCKESDVNEMSSERKMRRNPVFDEGTCKFVSGQVDERIRFKSSRRKTFSKEKLLSHVTGMEFKSKASNKTKGKFWRRPFRKHDNYNMAKNESEEFQEIYPEEDNRNFYEFYQKRRYGQDPKHKPRTFLGKLSGLTPDYDDVSHIQTSISFAAYVKRRGTGFTASCTQTLRRRKYNSQYGEVERELRSNVTFNPLFEDDDSVVEADLSVRWHRNPRKHRLYTIEEEAEPEEFDYNLTCSI